MRFNIHVSSIFRGESRINRHERHWGNMLGPHIINTKYVNKGFSEKEYYEACTRHDIPAMRFYSLKLAYAQSEYVNRVFGGTTTISFQQFIDEMKAPYGTLHRDNRGINREKDSKYGIMQERPVTRISAPDFNATSKEYD